MVEGVFKILTRTMDGDFLIRARASESNLNGGNRPAVVEFYATVTVMGGSGHELTGLDLRIPHQ